MKFLRFLISWQLWLSLLLIGGICYGIYYYVFHQWLFEHTKHDKEVNVPALEDLDIKTAIYKLDSVGLKYEIDSIKFDSTISPNKVLSFYPATGAAVKEGRTIFIKSNPSTWLPVELPELIDKSNRLAYTQLKIAGLEVGDTLYEPDIAKNVVLKVLYEGKQIPAGTSLPRFSKVDLVLGRGLLKDIPVPDFREIGLEKAKALIEQYYFEVGVIEYYGEIKDTLNTTVFFQDPQPNDILDQGLPINIWVSDSASIDIQDKITELEEQYKNIFEEDSATVEKYIQQRNNQNLRNLDLETRRQLDGTEQPTQQQSAPTRQTRRRQTAPPEENTDDLIIPDIQ